MHAVCQCFGDNDKDQKKSEQMNAPKQMKDSLQIQNEQEKKGGAIVAVAGIYGVNRERGKGRTGKWNGQDSL